MELTNHQLFNRLSTETLRQIRRESWKMYPQGVEREITVGATSDDNALTETMRVLNSVLLSRR